MSIFSLLVFPCAPCLKQLLVLLNVNTPLLTCPAMSRNLMWLLRINVNCALFPDIRIKVISSGCLNQESWILLSRVFKGHEAVLTLEVSAYGAV